MEGYNVFREWMLDHTEFDVDHYVTIQSLASAYMLKSGCYDDVYQVSGVYNSIYQDVWLEVG